MFIRRKKKVSICGSTATSGFMYFLGRIYPPDRVDNARAESRMESLNGVNHPGLSRLRCVKIRGVRASSNSFLRLDNTADYRDNETKYYPPSVYQILLEKKLPLTRGSIWKSVDLSTVGQHFTLLNRFQVRQTRYI